MKGNDRQKSVKHTPVKYSELADIIALDNMKCLNFGAFKKFFFTAPALLEILVVDNIRRKEGKPLSVADRTDGEVCKTFSVGELRGFLEFLREVRRRGLLKELAAFWERI